MNGKSNILTKNLDFILKKNTIISILFLTVITLAVIHYYDRNIGFTLCTILLPLFLYLYETDKKTKMKMLFIYFVFSILTFIGENIVVYKTKKMAISYNYTVKGLNVPSWLFLAYLNMLIFVWLVGDYFDTMY